MLLFVYGTMLSRGRNFRRLYECHAIRLAPVDTEIETEDRFDLYTGSKNGAPCAVRNEAGWPLLGELYAVPDEHVVNIIDAAEGHPDVYRREPVRLRGFDQTGLTIEMYVYARPVGDEHHKVKPWLGFLSYNT